MTLEELRIRMSGIKDRLEDNMALSPQVSNLDISIDAYKLLFEVEQEWAKREKQEAHANANAANMKSPDKWPPLTDREKMWQEAFKAGQEAFREYQEYWTRA